MHRGLWSVRISFYSDWTKDVFDCNDWRRGDLVTSRCFTAEAGQHSHQWAVPTPDFLDWSISNKQWRQFWWAPESDRQSGNPSRLTRLLLIFSYRRAKLTISSIFSNKPWLPPTHFSHLALSHNIILFRIKILSLGYYFVSLVYIVCLKLEMFFISLFLFTKYYSITARSRSECIEIVIPFMLIFIEIE